MQEESKLTPKMIARLLGVQMGDGSGRRNSAEEPGDGTRDVKPPVGDPLTELEERTRANEPSMAPSVTIGLMVIGMMMVAIGALLIFPISLSLEHARVIGGLGFSAVGVSVIYSTAKRALSSPESG